MGKQLAGKKVARRLMIRAFESQKKQADDRKLIIQNALMYNAGLHKALQHELCTCEHGASKHLKNEISKTDTRCEVVDCECPGFLSNYDQSLKNWKGELWAELQLAGHILFDLANPEHPMQEFKVIEAFEGGKKATEYKDAVLLWIKVQEENRATEPKTETQP